MEKRKTKSRKMNAEKIEADTAKAENVYRPEFLEGFRSELDDGRRWEVVIRLERLGI